MSHQHPLNSDYDHLHPILINSNFNPINPHLAPRHLHNLNHLPSNFAPDTVHPHQFDHLQTICSFKLASFLLVFLFIPLLSLAKFLPSTPSHRHSSYRHRQRRTLPVTYEPPLSTVEAPFVPLPTRRHFRISHIGNQLDEQSDSEQSSDSESISVHSYRLVFGRQARGEEPAFKGRSAMKGARMASRAAQPKLVRLTLGLGPGSGEPEPATSEPLGSSIKMMSFASQSAPRLATRLDSTISFLRSTTCALSNRNTRQL